MAEVKAVIAFMNEAGLGALRDRRRISSAAPPTTRTACAITDAAMAKAQAADAVLFGAVGGPKWDEVPYDAAARGGAAAAAQGARRLRQSAPGHLLPGARRRLVAEARAGRRARHPHPARADRRRLFRRAEGDPRPRQRPEARRRHAGLRHLRDRAHRPRRLRAGADAAEQASPRWRSATSWCRACSGTRW